MYRMVLVALVAGVIVLLAAPGARAANPFTDLTTSGVGPGNYGVFSLGGSGSQGMMDLSGATITGNVGVAASGYIDNQTGSAINGSVYESAAGQYTGAGGSLSGSTIINATLLASNNTGAATAASDASALTATQTFSGISATTTITGVAGLNVIDVNGNINLDNATLTLSGPKSAYFIINVAGGISLTGTTSLLVAGGVHNSDVLYNLTLASSQLITNSASPTTLHGIFLADGASSEIYLHDFNLDGELIGHNITLGSSSQVTQSGVVPEPSSLLLFSSGILGLAPLIWRGIGSRVHAA